jgi:PKD repeat protein
MTSTFRIAWLSLTLFGAALPDAPSRLPGIDPGGPYAARPGQVVSFAGRRVLDADAEDVAFAWDFGDGSFANEPTPTHRFAVPGDYTVTLLALGPDRLAVATRTQVVVTELVLPNRHPMAIDNGPYLGRVGEPILLDASGSSDADDAALSFAWVFGDGAVGSGPTQTHTYERPGTYRVAVLVTDGRGGASTTSTVAVIGAASPRANAAPIVEATGPAEAFAGEPVTFSATMAGSPSESLTYTWIFDDGERASGATVQHLFASLGSHIVTVVANDGRGGLAKASTTVKVGRTAANYFPVADIGGPYSGVVKTAVAFTAKASDPDGDEVQFHWSFGDGSAGSGSHPTHAYSSPGTYVVTLLVSDGNGDVTSKSTDVVIAPRPSRANHAPTADAGSAINTLVGKTVVFDAGRTRDVDREPLLFAWHFGDGTSDTGALVSHVYGRPGTYRAMVLVSDGKGGSDVATRVVTVAKP